MGDDIPNPFEELAEMIQAMATVATAARAYYVALTGEGFSEDQALVLTVAWQSSVLTMSKP